MNIFFCDVRGTINGKENDRNEQLLRLSNNLKNMCYALKIDELYFDFLSTENMESVLKYVKEIAPFLENSVIKLGTQFSEKEKFNNGTISVADSSKITQMRSIFENNDVKRIILADDTAINHKMLRHTLNTKKLDIELISLIPNAIEPLNNSYYSKQYGIEGLNESIESYIQSLSFSNDQVKRM